MKKQKNIRRPSSGFSKLRLLRDFALVWCLGPLALAFRKQEASRKENDDYTTGAWPPDVPLLPTDIKAPSPPDEAEYIDMDSGKIIVLDEEK